MSAPKCPKCSANYTYPFENKWVCSTCGHEWSQHEEVQEDESETPEVIRDAHGNILKDGDSVTIIKDLKVKGASGAVKSGTKVKNIRLVDAGDGHNITCKIDGFGAMNLKSEFVKKV